MIISLDDKHFPDFKTKDGTIKNHHYGQNNFIIVKKKV